MFDAISLSTFTLSLFSKTMKRASKFELIAYQYFFHFCPYYFNQNSVLPFRYLFQSLCVMVPKHEPFHWMCAFHCFFFFFFFTPTFNKNCHSNMPSIVTIYMPSVIFPTCFINVNFCFTIMTCNNNSFQKNRYSNIIR